jgi:hypothetical protein
MNQIDIETFSHLYRVRDITFEHSHYGPSDVTLKIDAAAFELLVRDSVEQSQITKQYAIELSIRNSNPSVQRAYDHYQLMLKLTGDL